MWEKALQEFIKHYGPPDDGGEGWVVVHHTTTHWSEGGSYTSLEAEGEEGVSLGYYPGKGSLYWDRWLIGSQIQYTGTRPTPPPPPEEAWAILKAIQGDIQEG